MFQKPLFKKKPFKIAIKIESHFKIPRGKQILCSTQNPLVQAYNLNFQVKQIGLKKKTKNLLVTLASPHVHKKSREQYKMDLYGELLISNIKNIQDYQKFCQ